MTRREAIARQQALRAAKASPAVVPRLKDSPSTSGSCSKNSGVLGTSKLTAQTTTTPTASATCSPTTTRTNNNDNKSNKNAHAEQRQEPYAGRSHCSDSTLLCGAESRLGGVSGGLDGGSNMMREKSPARMAKQWAPRAKYGATSSMSGETHAPGSPGNSAANHAHSSNPSTATSPDNGSAVRALRGALTQWPPEPGYRRKRPDIRVIEAPADVSGASSKSPAPSSPTSKVTSYSRSAPLFGLGQNTDTPRRGEQRANMQPPITKSTYAANNSPITTQTSTSPKPGPPPIPAKKHPPATQPKPTSCDFIKKSTPLKQTTSTPSPTSVERSIPTSNNIAPPTPPKTATVTGKASKHNPTTSTSPQPATLPKTSSKRSPKVSAKPVSNGNITDPTPNVTPSAPISDPTNSTKSTASTTSGIKSRKSRGSGLTRNRPGSRFTRKDEVEGTIFLNVKSSSTQSTSTSGSKTRMKSKTKTSAKSTNSGSLTPACPEDGTVSDISDAGSSKSGQVADAVAKWSNIGCKQQDYSTWRKPMTRLYR